jgi:hypothetical protein
LAPLHLLRDIPTQLVLGLLAIGIRRNPDVTSPRPIVGCFAEDVGRDWITQTLLLSAVCASLGAV